MLASLSSGLSPCDREDWPAAVLCSDGPCNNVQMRKDSLRYPCSQSFTQWDKSTSGVLGFYDLIAYDLQRLRHDTLKIYISLGISYLLLLKFYFLDFRWIFKSLYVFNHLLLIFYSVVIFCLLAGFFFNILDILLSLNIMEILTIIIMELLAIIFNWFWGHIYQLFPVPPF